MPLLADQIDGVVGVDTHRDTLTAAVVSPIGALLANAQVPADAAGYRRLLELARQHVPGRRCWALEGAGSYGAGLAEFLDTAEEQVIEVCRPKRPATRGGRKTDALDAVRAAREALTSEHLIHPRRRGEREAVRVLLATRAGAVLARTAAVNQLKALIVSAPEALRAELRGRTTSRQIASCQARTTHPGDGIELRATVRALRCTAERIQTLTTEAKELEKEIHLLVQAMAPELLALVGVGPISAAQILVSWSHQGRFRSDAAFAAFAGAAPIPASSGLTTRHRLNRAGDRQLNRALHTIVLVRARVDPATRAYIAKRTAEGKSSRDAQRCLKRAVARQVFKLLERQERSAAPADRAPQAA